MRIFLIRHGESEANLDKGLNASLADHKIRLSERGQEEAKTAGKVLTQHLIDTIIPAELALQAARFTRNAAGETVSFLPEGFRPIHFRLWQSPYDRTRQTADGVWSSLQQIADIPGISLDRREDDLLREQSFGLFDGIPDEDLPVLLPREHAQYRKFEQQQGRYFAQMPMGESRADVSQRLRTFFGSIQRDREITEDRQHGIENIIVVSHGVTIRCFVKEWCHYRYEWIEEEKNPANCSIRVIENGKDQGYLHRGWQPSVSHERQERRETGVVDTSGLS